MPITFDTLDELKAFYRSFKLEEKGTVDKAPAYTAVDSFGEAPKRRGRPALVKAIAEDDEDEDDEDEEPTPVRGRGSKGVKASSKPVSSKKMLAPRRDKETTLTARIQNAIRTFLGNKRSFTANDVYAVLARQDSEVNKQSVITSVLKQMNSTFKTVSVAERPGNGPRPVKMYNL